MADSTIAASWVAAWLECQNASLDSYNPHFKNSYASWEATMRAIRDVCSNHGLAYMQKLRVTENGLMLTSCVMDATGNQLPLSEYPIAIGQRPQETGSAITYAKRYQAQCDWGIAGADDDGEAASWPQQQPTGRKTQKQQSIPQNGSKGPQKTNSDAFDRTKCLTAAAQLRQRVIEGGVAEKGIDSWMEANLGTCDTGRLTNEQVVQYGSYLREMDNSINQLSEEGK